MSDNIVRDGAKKTLWFSADELDDMKKIQEHTGKSMSMIVRELLAEAAKKIEE